MIKVQWETYAKTWSMDGAARDVALCALAAKNMTYTAPNINVVGRAVFSAYIAQFQKNIPDGILELLRSNLIMARLCRIGSFVRKAAA